MIAPPAKHASPMTDAELRAQVIPLEELLAERDDLGESGLDLARGATRGGRLYHQSRAGHDEVCHRRTRVAASLMPTPVDSPPIPRARAGSGSVPLAGVGSLHEEP